ncbi:MAG: Fic family protein [Candidatus Gastranaerophilaceae bacterium]
MTIQYITIEQAIETHKKTILYSGGGVYGHLNVDQLESVLEHIKNDDYYPTFIDKLTHLFFCACKFHCFEDGNKRIAITLSAYFLLLNGHMAIAKDFFVIMENISYEVASGKISKELLHRIMTAIMDSTYNHDEELKLEIYNSIQ